MAEKQKLTHCDKLTGADAIHLGQHDLEDEYGNRREATVEIAGVRAYVPERPKKNEKRNKLEIRFAQKRKTWICGPVSKRVIKSLYGPYIEHWVGKRITLYVDPEVTMGRDKTGGLRVRPNVPRGPLSTEPLDNPVDDEAAARRAAAADEANGREPGEEG